MRKQVVDANPLILFDGSCGMCSRLVGFVLRNESSKTLQFVPNNSEYGRLLSNTHGLDVKVTETVVLIDSEGVHLYSDAVFRIANFLNAPWSWIRHGVWIPKPLRDSLYRFVARNRHRFMGRTDPTCFVVSEEDRERIVEHIPNAQS